MRLIRVILAAGFLALFSGVLLHAERPTAAVPAIAIGASQAFAQSAPEKAVPDVDVKVTEHRIVWYADPTVLAVGGGALLLLILIVLAVTGRL